VTGADVLVSRAETMERLARWYRQHACRSQGSRARALLTSAQAMEAEALRTAEAAAGA